MSLAEPIIPLRKVQILNDHQNMRSVTLLSRRSLTFLHFVCDKRCCHYRRHFQQKNLTRICLTRAQANAHTLLVCKYWCNRVDANALLFILMPLVVGTCNNHDSIVWPECNINRCIVCRIERPTCAVNKCSINYLLSFAAFIFAQPSGRLFQGHTHHSIFCRKDIIRKNVIRSNNVDERN